MSDSDPGGSESAVVDAHDVGDAGASAPSNRLLWGVGAVAAQLDIARPTLRSWDRRYGLGPSLRTVGGHRRYTDTDVARVRLMNRLLDTGVAAAQAAHLACTATDDELATGTSPTRTGRQSAGTRRRASSTVEGLVRAARDLQTDDLSRAVSVQLRRRGASEAWHEVFVPFLIEIGQKWSLGELGIESEHLASGVLAAELRTFTALHRSSRPIQPQVLLTCAENEQHALAVYALEAALAERKIPSLVLGQQVPASALRRAMLSRQPTLVFVWASLTQHADAGSPWNLDPEVVRHVLLGGPGWPDDTGEPHGHPRVERVHDLDSAVARIERALQS